MTGAAAREVALPDGLADVGRYVRLACRAEELGYDRVSLPEETDWEAATLLGVLAARTEEVGLSNDAFSPFARSPALLGQTAATVQAVSGGRYRLGLGTDTPGVAERWHGATFERPLRRLRETIDVVRRAAAGERVDYDGEVFDLHGFGMRVTAAAGPPPIDVAALGPAAVELVGRFADGWVPRLFTPDGLRERLADLRRGAGLGDRDPDEVRISPVVRCCALPDGERAREMARRQVAFTLAASGPDFRESVARQGYEDVTAAVAARWDEGDRQAAVAAVPDDLLDGLVAAGTPDEVRETVSQFAAVDAVDAVRVGFFDEQMPDERRETLVALAPNGD